jgi:predicted  nucleic acid-binding Zn-ribbon protein
MKDQQAMAASQVESAHEVDRIRDIIFGSQMRDYEQRFQTLLRDLDRLQKEIDRLGGQLTDQESEHGKKLQNLRQEMRQADDDLRDELRGTTQQLATDKVDRVALGDLFIEIGTQLKSGSSLADLLAGLEEKESK